MGILTGAIDLHPDIRRRSGAWESKPIVEAGVELAAGRRSQETMFRFKHFREYVADRNHGLLKYEHAETLIEVCNDVVLGVEPRVLVFAPPRYFKSEFCSRLLPGYNLTQHAQDSVAMISYGDSLALELSENARDNFVNAGGFLKPGTEGKKRWATAQGGMVWASGVGGRILGKGFRLGIIDDPVDPEQAVSFAYQQRFQRFWSQKFIPRQEPNARIILIMQRLGPEDPADFLFRREVGEETEEAPEHWLVVCLDEIRSDEPLGRWNGPMGLPPTCTLDKRDLERRKIGEVLAPSRFSKPDVKKLQQASGPYTTAAQRQQRPTSLEGDFWKEKWFQTYTELPKDAYDGGKDWDTAYTKDDVNAASGYIETFRGLGGIDEFPIYIEDVDWDWKEFPELTEWMKSLVGPHYVEQKATGKSIVQVLSAQGIAAEEVPVVGGDKFARSQAVQSVVSNRRVHVNQRVRQKLLKGERQGLLRITALALSMAEGSLDVNDMFVQAIQRHLGLGAKKKKKVAFR